MTPRRTTITLKMLLEHLRGMEQRLSQEIGSVREDLQALDGNLSRRMDRLNAHLTAQIDAIDQRLDKIEVERLPRRVGALEQKRAR